MQIGLALAPDPAWLARCEPLLAGVDYVSVTPETTWKGRPEDPGALAPNGFGRAFRDLRAGGMAFVAHTVAYNLGGSAGGGASGEEDRDAPRRARWREAMARDHADFGFLWWTEHSGITTAAGEYLALPLPVPFTEATAAVAAARLAEMRSVVPTVGMENSAFPFLAGPALDEPAWIAAAIGAAEGRDHLLLDLHNLWASSINFGFDPVEWLAAAPLERVIEIHLAGGRAAPEGWTSRPMRLDSHDVAVPEAVWALYRRALPRCTGLRGVTLERLEGSVGAADVMVLAGELRRARAGG